MDKRAILLALSFSVFSIGACAASGGADVSDGEDASPPTSGNPPDASPAGSDAHGVDAPSSDTRTWIDSSTSASDTGATSDAGSTGNPWCSGAPITGAAPSTWSWLPVPEAKCGKGVGLGIAVNPSPSSDKLVIFLNGGGGCWDGPSCAGGMSTPVANMDGDYSMTKLTNDMSAFQPGSVFDRSSPSNPFKDWSYVFVPYCTGDFHGGAVHTSYDVDHMGYADMTAYLKRIVPTWCTPDRVVLMGVSAGGYGSVFDFEQVHEAFGSSVHVDLIDDSGAFWRPGYGDDKYARLHAAWGTAMAPADCSACASDWSALFPYLSKKYPDSRFSVISSIYDFTICPYFGITTPDACANAFDDIADSTLTTLPNFRVFYIASNQHVWLGRDLSSTSTGGVTLQQFIEKQVSGDAGWSSVRP